MIGRWIKRWKCAVLAASAATCAQVTFFCEPPRYSYAHDAVYYDRCCYDDYRYFDLGFWFP